MMNLNGIYEKKNCGAGKSPCNSPFGLSMDTRKIMEERVYLNEFGRNEIVTYFNALNGS
jgi:hypothetical protein